MSAENSKNKAKTVVGGKRVKGDVKADSVAVKSMRLKVFFNGIKSTQDNSVMSMSYSPNTYGFTFKDGTLRTELGVKQLAPPFGSEILSGTHKIPVIPGNKLIVGLYLYQRSLPNGSYNDRFVAQTSDNLLFQFPLFTTGSWSQIANTTFSGRGCAVNYNYNSSECLILCSSTGNLTILNDDVITTVADAPRFSSICVHNERLFGTSIYIKNRVWFSDDFNPTNWKSSLTEGGFITFEDGCGNAIKVVSFLDYVYVFREYGIFRITAYGDQTEFCVTQVYVGTGRIYPDTIAQYGDRIYFLADDGLYIFDGYNVKEIAKELPTLHRKSSAVGVVLDGKYYLSARLPSLKSGNTWTNNALLVYDPDVDMFSMIEYADCSRMIPVQVHNASLIAVVNGAMVDGYTLGMIVPYGILMSNPTLKHWESPVNDLGTEKRKIVREIFITTTAEITFGVIVDGVTYPFTLQGATLPQRISVNKRGKKIGFEINCSVQDCTVAPFTVIIDVE